VAARDAEVEQFGFALGIHQNVRGLDVAMKHKVAVRVLDRTADLLKQDQAVAQRRWRHGRGLPHSR